MSSSAKERWIGVESCGSAYGSRNCRCARGRCSLSGSTGYKACMQHSNHETMPILKCQSMSACQSSIHHNIFTTSSYLYTNSHRHTSSAHFWHTAITMAGWTQLRFGRHPKNWIIYVRGIGMVSGVRPWVFRNASSWSWKYCVIFGGQLLAKSGMNQVHFPAPCGWHPEIGLNMTQPVLFQQRNQQ